jgi:acyl carrier protein
MMTTKHVIESTRRYISENFLYARPDFVVDERDSLLGRGVIDSLGVMEIVEFLATEFGVVAQDDDMTEQNFGSLAGIARFVVQRTGADIGEPVKAEA